MNLNFSDILDNLSVAFFDHPDIFVVVVSSIFGVLVVGFFSWNLQKLGLDKPSSFVRGLKTLGHGITGGLVTMLVVLFLCWFFFLEPVPIESVLVTKDRQAVVATFLDGGRARHLWKFDSRLGDYDFARANPIIVMSLKFYSTDENQQVRYFSHSVELKTADSLENVLKRERITAPFNHNASRWLTYQMYEFEKIHGKDIAKLSNPLDVNQQSDYQELVHGFMEKSLQDSGMEFAKASFSSAR